MAKVSPTTITSGYLPITQVNNNFALVAAAIENTLSRDGTSPNTMLADLDLNSHKVINLAAPVNLNDAARLTDVQSAVLGSFTNFAISGVLTSSSVKTTGYVSGGNSPLNPGGLGGNRWVIDNQAGQTRVFTYGTDVATNGSFVINSQRSNGTNALDILTLSAAGLLSIAGGIKISGVGGSTAGSMNLSGGTQFQIVGGTSGFAVVDSTSSFNNISISDAGNTTIRGTLNGPASMLSPITNSLGANVALNNTANFFDGPSIAQGTSGTWFASGTVSVTDSSAASIEAKLWDGTTVISSTRVSVAAGNNQAIALSGFITSPAANIRISVKDGTNTTGLLVFNTTGNSKDCTITAIRIA